MAARVRATGTHQGEFMGMPRAANLPAIWLPDPSIRRERELARFRLHLVRHRTTLKNRMHATLIAFARRGGQRSPSAMRPVS